MSEKEGKTPNTRALSPGEAGGAGIIIVGLAALVLHGGGSHHTPNTQPGNSAPASAAPSHTHEATKPKVSKAPSLQPVAPVRGPNILSWPQKQEALSNDTVDLSKVPGQHETLVFSGDSVVKSMLIMVRSSSGASVSFNVTLSDIDHDHENTVSVDGQTGVLGQTAEIDLPGGIALYTSGDAPEDAYALGVGMHP